mmetsp:Transcript_4094/g.9765  ORF Transcript_4094/g.9765 Transcript_4094/m.9765 type:complete len:224 (+) Transcript_4094:201-872(+)
MLLTEFFSFLAAMKRCSIFQWSTKNSLTSSIVFLNAVSTLSLVCSSNGERGSRFSMADWELTSANCINSFPDDMDASKRESTLSLLVSTRPFPHFQASCTNLWWHDVSVILDSPTGSSVFSSPASYLILSSIAKGVLNVEVNDLVDAKAIRCATNSVIADALRAISIAVSREHVKSSSDAFSSSWTFPLPVFLQTMILSWDLLRLSTLTARASCSTAVNDSFS